MFYWGAVYFNFGAAKKRLFGLKDLTYNERLVHLNLSSLELRQLYLDLILCYKIVFGLVCVNFDDFFTFSPSSQTRGHSFVQTI